MQTRLRETVDGDLTEGYSGIAEFRSGQHHHEVNCGVCNKWFFADRETFGQITRSIELGLDNPFICDECRQEYEDLAFGAR